MLVTFSAPTRSASSAACHGGRDVQVHDPQLTLQIGAGREGTALSDPRVQLGRATGRLEARTASLSRSTPAGVGPGGLGLAQTPPDRTDRLAGAATGTRRGPSPYADIAMTSTAQERLGERLRAAATRLESAEVLDHLVAPFARAADAVLGRAPLRDALAGRWLGHALHPLLTDFPLGLWIGTSFLDILGGDGAEGSADRLLAGGVLAAIPTMASGVVDWLSAGRPAQRVGVVHAGSNTLAWTLYAASLLSRRRGRRRTGVLLAVGGGVLANVGGYLGGHLSLVVGVPPGGVA
jgi:uncharacterized membrane protein